MSQEWRTTNPILLELSSSLLGYLRVLEPAGLWAGRSSVQGNSHPPGKGPISLPLPSSLCLEQTEELGKARLPNGTWLPLLGPCAVDGEREVFGWELNDLQIFEDDSFWSPLPLTGRQVGFPRFPTGATGPKALWGTVWVKHHVHCSILCPAQWILPGSA